MNGAEGEGFMASFVGLAQFGNDRGFVNFELAVWEFGSEFHNTNLSKYAGM